MAIPILSSTPVVGAVRAPDNMPKRPLVDYELGGVALSDNSMGTTYQTWRAWFDRPLGGVFIEAPNTPPIKIFEQSDIEWLSFCFDQNMRWSATYTLTNNKSYLRWYDSAQGGYSITELQENVISPFLTLDDKRATQSGNSDIVLAYIKEQKVCLRVQRERFQIVHIWAEKIPKDWIIRNFGMSNKMRLQMEIR